MNMPIEVLMSVSQPSLNTALFATAFPGTGLSPKTLAAAIATYERTVVSEQAPFDVWIEETSRQFPTRQSGFCHLQHQGSVLNVP